MSLQSTPLAERLKIVFFGLRNAGKSSLLNALFERDISIVSDTPGTTTDPVTKALELLPLGPVAVTDTAGLDDEGELGKLRVEKSAKALSECDIPVLVSPADRSPTDIEIQWAEEWNKKKKTFLIALSFASNPENASKAEWAKLYPHAKVDSPARQGIAELKKLILARAEQAAPEMGPVEGLVNENDLVVLVTPIDLAAPKGRLILPQVETIRDLLDHDCAALIVKEREFGAFYPKLPERPKLVITDSQAFSKVSSDIPPDQPLTSFSILFARKKGDLARFVAGTKKLEHLKAGSKVLILESCSHHQQADDIGTVKIPRLFRQLADPNAEFIHRHEIPSEEELKTIGFAITCGACMVSRNAVLKRLDTLDAYGIPYTNYGLFLAWANGLLPRAIEPFPLEREIWES